MKDFIDLVDGIILSTEYLLRENDYGHDEDDVVKDAVALALSQGKQNIRKAVEKGLITEEEAEEIYVDNNFSWMDAYENAGLIPEEEMAIMERKWDDKRTMNNYGSLFDPESDRPIMYGDSEILFNVMKSIDWEMKKIKFSDGNGNTVEGNFGLTKEDEPEPGYFEKNSLGRKIGAVFVGGLLFGVGASLASPLVAEDGDVEPNEPVCNSVGGNFTETPGVVENVSEVSQVPDDGYLVYGAGDCCGIGGDNIGWDPIFGHIKGNLSIGNSDDGNVVPHFLWIKDLETGEIKTKGELPPVVNLQNFNGYGYIDNYNTPHGSWGAKFGLVGYSPGENSNLSDLEIEENLGNFLGIDGLDQTPEDGCLVFGAGDIFRIFEGKYPDGDFDLIESNRGPLKGNLTIINQDGDAPWPYGLWFMDLESGEIKNKKDLPHENYLPNFRGMGHINYYHSPHGPTGTKFRLIGYSPGELGENMSSKGGLGIITVDDEPGDAMFTSIREAIDAADQGDIIEVYGGNYCEPVELNKEMLTLKGTEDIKDNEPIPIISTGLEPHNLSTAIEIYKGRCTVEGFKLDKNYRGIRIRGNENKINKNDIVNNSLGVIIESRDNIISNNQIENSNLGVLVMKPDNVLKENDIVGNVRGVDLYTPSNKITSNNFIGNEEQADFWYSLLSLPWRSNWNGNYWSDWDSRAPRPVHGRVAFGDIPFFPWTNYDLAPRQRPA
ncbi:MAG: NosD domain-containing protein [Candidatus Aenigmatarchaeota archaeon]